MTPNHHLGLYEVPRDIKLPRTIYQIIYWFSKKNIDLFTELILYTTFQNEAITLKLTKIYTNGEVTIYLHSMPAGMFHYSSVEKIESRLFYVGRTFF